MSLPRNDWAIDWVSSSLKRPLTDIEGELVTILCAATKLGPYNLGRWRSLEGREDYAEKSILRSRLATFDFDGLTALVFAAHDRCVRIELGNGGPGRIKIIAHRRIRRADLAPGDWATPKIHPTLEEAVESWRSRQ